MEDNCSFQFHDNSRRIYNKKYPVYAVKFCPYSDENIFAAAVLNRIEIHKIKDDAQARLDLVKSYVTPPSEELYALDWSLNKQKDGVVLIAGGMNGKIYNILDSSVFGIKEKENSINDIKFNPNIQYLFAVAYGNGLIHLYNVETELCVAIFNTMRVSNYLQSIAVTFDTTGNFMAFGGMTKEIFLVNLKNNEEFQDVLVKSCSKDEQFLPANFNLLHNVCVVQSLHNNYIDMILWYGEYAFITKSCDGKIVFWCIDGAEQQSIPLSTSEDLKVVKMFELFVDNCTLWFVRFGVDRLMNHLTIGNSSGDVLLFDLKGDSFSDWKCHVLTNPRCNAIARYFSFSNCGNFFVYCADDGSLGVFRKQIAVDENANSVAETSNA